MSIYNNIKLTAPPIRVGDDPDLVPPLDSGSLEQVATMAPIMGSFRGILNNNNGEYLPFIITPPRSVNTLVGTSATYPYNTLHLKGIALKEQQTFQSSGGTITTGFEYWTAITNPYIPLLNINLPIASVDQSVFFPTIGANDTHPLSPNVTPSNNSPIQSVSADWNGNGSTITSDSIILNFLPNPNLENFEPFFIKGQYLLL